MAPPPAQHLSSQDDRHSTGQYHHAPNWDSPPAPPPNAMTHQFFKRKEHSELYQKYMYEEPEELRNLILSYLHEKENTFRLAIDVGCGTGSSSRMLVPYFQKVVGVDISRTQIEEAERNGSFPNLSFKLASAEQLPFDDCSVDLITAAIAAHWFVLDKFLKEVDRVLKPGGCLALYCVNPYSVLHHEGCSEKLTSKFREAFQYLDSNYGAGLVEEMKNEYKEIFAAVPYTDKKRVANIFLKHPLSVAGLMGYIKSMYVLQNFNAADPEGAKHFMDRLQNSILETLGTPSMETQLELWGELRLRSGLQAIVRKGEDLTATANR